MRNYHTHGNGNDKFNSSNIWPLRAFSPSGLFPLGERLPSKNSDFFFQFRQLFRSPLTKAFLKDEEFVQKKLGPGEIVPPSLGVTQFKFRTESQIKAPSKPEWLERSFEANHPNKNSRTAILFLHGRMGKGRRAVVPECIGRLPFNPIPLKCRSYHFHILHLLFFSGQNSRDVPWGRWQLHGFPEEGSWREDILKV